MQEDTGRNSFQTTPIIALNKDEGAQQGVVVANSNIKDPMLSEDPCDVNAEEKNRVTKISLRCKCRKPKPIFQIIDISFLVGMVGLGFFIMVNGFISVIKGSS